MSGTEDHDPAQEHRPEDRESADRPLGSLFRELSRNAVELVRQEIDLARTEMSRKITRAGRDSMFVTAGAAVAYAGFLFLLVAVVMALALVMPVSLAAFIVGFPVLCAGLIAVLVGKRRLSRENFVPNRTLDILREDKKWKQDRLM